jgi:CelD/BcsL family acetyltransferase involved in cellulose biosynthesis
MDTNTHIDWLDASDARKRLRARPWRLSQPGQDALLAAFERAERVGDNLSLGLYHNRRVQAHLLAWIEHEPAQRSCVRVVELRAGRTRRQDGVRLLSQLAWLLRHRDDLAALPVRVADDAELLAALGNATKPLPADVRALLLSLLGSADPPLDLQRVRQHDEAGSTVRVGVVESIEAWDRLRPAWNQLLAATPGATVFQTFEFLRAWWYHLGWSDRLYIVVVERAGVPVAIAPFQVTRQRWLGFWFETLIYLGQPPESDRPLVLRRADDLRSLDYVAEYVFADAGRWQQVILREQLRDDPFAERVLARFRAAGWLTAVTEGPTCPVVAVDRAWPEYLATRPKAIRKSLRRKESTLATAGPVELAAPDGAAALGLGRYLAVEQRSWKAGARRIGVAQSSAYLAFYHALARNCAETLGLRFRFLTVAGRDIAATFGLLWRDRLYSLHIAHDSAWDRHSPGVVLTARELQQGFERREYAVFDFLSGVLPNKGSWATALLPTADVHFDRRNLRGALHHVIEFRLRPPLKRLLARAGLLPRVLRWKERLQGWLE